ncbi:serine phosphatase RsbU, regulator of sigma subunit [Bernardetia litoralis DSM 6794]|uniref:Serine phosphatase RsbU, regulator of sigma subunit n=1 Tax=Bernardetia litoralis (strain ATCC 23117 / DSM 6794 / NBRC 15988 / NCIMB 1366 / Fx l1 / Sio-4) TaxID=880071 RepID=I4AL44_BERLS|nr:7TM diverse intracellular signaling domain-containing protein [Bernardetia litoralis]AFM04679.1 serine phosphatase RsbU, regulator of sigma subunit [Bernardetia litoralis DSM 6794]
MKYIYIYIVLAYFISYSVQSQNIISFSEETELIELDGKKVTFFEDKDHAYTLEQVLSQSDTLFKEVEQDIPNFANTTSTIWGKFSVRNSTQKELLFELANPLLDNLTFFYPNSTNSYEKLELGAKQIFSTRPFQLNNFVIPLAFENDNQTKTYYFKILSEYPIELPMKIATSKKITETNHIHDVLYGIYFGFLIVMSLYNFFIFLSTRDKTYFYYILYISSIVILYGNFKGYSFEFLWGSTPSLNYYIPTLVSLISIFILLFSTSFLDTKKNFRKTHITAYVLMGIFAIPIILNFAGLYAVAAPLSQLFSLLLSFYILFIAFYSYFKGVKIARFFALAWFVFLIGIIIFMLQVLGVIASTPLTQNATIIGSAIEVVLLSFALADRINVYKKQKEEAQQEALEKTKENEKLVTEQNKVLEVKVKEATEELSISNEELNSTNEELNAMLETVQEQKDTIEERSTEIEAINEEVKATNEELNSTNEELSSTVETVKKQNKIIADSNRSITDSLRYAQTIQDAILPFEERMDSHLKDYFTFYRPKDIVSGDFYWLTDLKGKIYLAVADCTGHGVPGAFMSMIGSAALDALVDRNELEQPDKILEELHLTIQKALKQKNSTNDDGMDVGLCVLEYLPNGECKILFSGAKRPFYYYKQATQEFLEIKGTRQSIGGYSKKQRHVFEVNEIILEKGDCFYLCSDGYVDQNDKNDNKFGSPNLKKLIHDIAPLSMEKQGDIIKQKFDEHKGEEAQRDDIAFIGVRVS